MTIQLWHLLAVFVAGLFIGSNLGVLVMCVVNVWRRDEREHGILQPWDCEQEHDDAR